MQLDILELELHVSCVIVLSLAVCNDLSVCDHMLMALMINYRLVIWMERFKIMIIEFHIYIDFL